MSALRSTNEPIEDPPAQGPGQAASSLADTAALASVWVIGGYGTGQLLRFVGNLILTRLMFPEVFGLATLVSVLLQGLQMFSDVGAGPAIVQSARGDDRRFLDTAWTVSGARGIVLWLASCVVAIPVAAFYGEPMLAQVLPVAGLTAAINGFDATAFFSAQRHLRAKLVTGIELTAQATQIVSTILLVLAFPSYRSASDLRLIWMVIAGSIIAAVTRLALTHVVLPGTRNRLHIERDALRLLFSFGRWVFLSTVLTFLSGQSDRLLLGKLASLELLGVYGIALNLAQLAAQGVQRVGSAVLFPAFSRLEAKGELRASFRRARQPLLLGGAAVASALMASGPFLIHTLYDARYAEAGWMVQVLAVAAWFQVLDGTNTCALLAQGRLRWMVVGNATKLLSVMAFVPLGMYAGGFPGAIAGLVASDLIKYLTSALATARRGLVGLPQDIGLSLGIAVVAGAGMLAGRVAASFSHSHSSLMGLVVSTLVAAAVWAVVSVRHALSEPAGRKILARVWPFTRRS